MGWQTDTGLIDSAVNRPHSPSFLRNLGFWLIHSSLNSCPGFYLALQYRGVGDQPPAILGMLAAILTFAFAYAILTTYYRPLSDKASLFHQALKVGLKIRVIVVILSLISFPLGFFFSPDLWCGVAVVSLYRAASVPLDLPPFHTFPAIYSMTILEGLLLSITLFIFSFLALLVLNAKAKRKALEESALPHG